MFGKIFDPDGLPNRIADILIGIVVTGLMTIVFSIPLVTMGTAVSAGYYAMAKAVRHHEGYVWKEFWSSFRRNIRTGIGPGIGYTVAGLILAVDLVYLKGSTGSMKGMLMLAVLAAAVITGMTFFFVFIELSRFDMGSFEIFRFGVISAFRHLPAALTLVLTAAAAVFLVWIMPWGLFLFPGLAVYADTFLMERVLKKYSPNPGNDPDEADKWYNR